MLRPLLLASLSLPLLAACSVERTYDNLNVDGFETVRQLEPGQVALHDATLDGDIGPISGLAGDGVGTGYLADYGSEIRIDGETGRGTAFVLLWVNDPEAFVNLPRGVAHTFTADDPSVVSGAGCSDTFEGEHYDATAQEISLVLEDVDANTVEVSYDVWSHEGDLSGSSLDTSASGSFQMDVDG